MRSYPSFILSILSLSCLFAIGCGGETSPPAASIEAGGSSSGGSGESLSGSPVSVESGGMADTYQPQERESHPEVVLTTNYGAIRIRLNAEKAPATVDNFLNNYVESGQYDGSIFHYVAPGSMILGGAFTADLQANPTRSEIQSEAANGLKNVRGTIAMTRDPEYIHSATNQFFINLADNPNLDHVEEDEKKYGYCVFGEVVEGMDVVDKIAAAPVKDVEGFPSLPVESVVIQSAKRVR
ncbi:peptidylprolyl isomerase [Blastopirellula sp. JC732]|uniref:Peptidyl-prolyl cis-trans isomerase n=1 Tax=Blastopirellula sediminis TaxID=2894196 RepID=A0A9X1MKD4_9BACT|nr:peptidylprolyl isomerase [Blastopirellula sediminis]MCC9609082.1 peptidylprolyl isomerase [Blastopirellula sediminis]MCC9628141.1 peptidylprolyl isomerase [Blastopirellula sediminis]